MTENLAFHHGEGLIEAESQMAFWAEADVFLAGGISSASTGTGANSAANQCALAAAGLSAAESASAGATTDHLQVALLVRFAGLGNSGGINPHVIAMPCQ